MTLSPADQPRPALVVPTYNNAATLIGVLRRADALAIPIIVVNDGSTDATASRLTEWARHRQGGAPASVTRYERNRGKAAALRTGLALARRIGCTHAVTIDSDGQHDPEQVPTLLAAARRFPRALILGARRTDLPGYPPMNLLGRRLANLGLRLACGVGVTDSQCGMRVYPLDLVEAVPCPADRYAYETEIIARAVWAGRRVVEVPIRSRYLPRPQRVSHYRLWRDTLACARTHARLLLRKLSTPLDSRPGRTPRRPPAPFVDRPMRGG